MPTDVNEWWYVGAAAVGSLAVGMAASSLLGKDEEPVDTGVHQSYRIKGDRKSEVIAMAYAHPDGTFTAELDAPYGFRNQELELDSEKEPPLSPHFKKLQSAMTWADRELRRAGYKPRS
jgi:hypothetical protein